MSNYHGLGKWGRRRDTHPFLVLFKLLEGRKHIPSFTVGQTKDHILNINNLYSLTLTSRVDIGHSLEKIPAEADTIY